MPTVARLSSLAGNTNGRGSADGTRAAASFNNPIGIATDSSGNLYLADTFNNTIREITPAGVVTTLAGSAGVAGSADGTGAAASFHDPEGIATDSAGNIYVADTNNNTIRKITPTDVVITFAGSGTIGHADGTGAAASFYFPKGIATDSVGNVYVTDSQNDTIREITPAGVVTTLAGSAGVAGSADGTGAAASFNDPEGIATDSAGNVYVADYDNATIREITPGGVVTTLAGSGTIGHADGTGVAASFFGPKGIATDSSGNVYVADNRNNNIRKITPSGNVTTLAGTTKVGSADGIGAAASFNDPEGITTDSVGNIYVADTQNETMREITPAGVVTTLAGTAPVTGSADGTGAAASFNGPQGIATDSVGNVYVADYDNATIREITPAGVVMTLAGAARTYGHVDGTSSAARFYAPVDVATDSAGNVYVADDQDDTIRKITPAGVVTTLAGSSGAAGHTDGTGAAASFNSPEGIATDSVGNVYVADTYNNLIREITPEGVVTTLAGTAGVSGSADGIGAGARFNLPYGIATDSAGNVYVADTHNYTIRMITPAGTVTTLAGSAGVAGSADGTGAAASFNDPEGIATDSAGNVYVADHDNATIREITPGGVVTTVAGEAGNGGFAAGNLPGLLMYPSSVAISGNTLYTTTNNAIVQVTGLPK